MIQQFRVEFSWFRTAWGGVDMGLATGNRSLFWPLWAVLFFPGSAVQAITINVSYDDTQAGAVDPGFDTNGALLVPIFDYAANLYESVFPQFGHTIDITFWYTDLPDGQLGNHDNLSDDINGREDVGTIRIDTQNTMGVARNYYYDPTPANNSEFNMTQTFWRDLTVPNRNDWYLVPPAGMVPDTFETSFTGTAPGGSPAVGATDMLTLVLHEMGHAIGMSGGTALTVAETMDGDYDFTPSWVFGSTLAADNVDQATDFIGHLDNPDALMAPSLGLSTGGGSAGVRKLPSHTDLMSMAAGHNYTLLDLPRREFYNNNGDYNTDGNWSGDNTPDNADDTFIRSGRTAVLSGFGAAGNLNVLEGALVSTQANTLFVQNTTTIAGTPGNESRITVSNNGELDSDQLVIDDDGLLVMGGANALLQAEDVTILPGGQLRGQGTVDINDNLFGELVSEGLIRATGGGTLTITSGNGIALDFAGGDVEAIDGNIDVNTGFFDSIAADITVGAGRQIDFGLGATIGAGSLLQLDGAPGNAATVTGSTLFVGLNGAVNGNVLGVVENALVLQPSSLVTTEFGDPNSEIRLNGATFFQGGRVLGDGVARQNGDATVTADTDVTIDTYDMDGQTGNTVITIQPDATLDIDSDQIDTNASDGFDGTANVNSGVLDIQNPWRLDGVLNLNKTAAATPEVRGGTMTIHTTGQLNVSGEGDVFASTVINGGVFVGSDANFEGSATVNATATLETDSPGDVIRFKGTTNLLGGSYVGNGLLAFDDTVNVQASTTIGMADTDMDGNVGAGVTINVDPDVTFSIASITLETSGSDGFDGTMNLEGVFATTVPFRLDGTLNMTESSPAPAPQLNGFSGFTIHTTGEVNSTGDAQINRLTTANGDINVGVGRLSINAATTFGSTAGVTVVSGGELLLNGATFQGGSYTGQGLIQFNNSTFVSAATTMDNRIVDLDGDDETTETTISEVPFVLNVERIDVSSNIYSGTMNVTGEGARLEVNLLNPVNSWRLASTGTLNFDTGAVSALTMLDGNDLFSEGAINALGKVGIAVNVGHRGDLTTQSAGTDVHFRGGGRSFFYNTSSTSGLGSMTIENGTTVNLEDATNVGIDVENLGRLEIGFAANEVSVDFVTAGDALIRGNFSQAAVGEFAVDLGGQVQGDKYDWLDVIGNARLGGEIEVQLIDGFTPMIGDMFQVLTAGSVIGTFAEITTLDEDGILDFDLTAVYSATDVKLVVDNVYLSADFDRDGDVDIADLMVFQQGFGQAGQTDNTMGDADGNGTVGPEDLGFWENQFGMVFPVAAAALVPEPGGAVLLLGFAVCVRARSRGARRPAPVSESRRSKGSGGGRC